MGQRHFISAIGEQRLAIKGHVLYLIMIRLASRKVYAKGGCAHKGGRWESRNLLSRVRDFPALESHGKANVSSSIS